MHTSFGNISHPYVGFCFYMGTSWDLGIVLLHENILLAPGIQVTIFTCWLILQKYTKTTNNITNSLLLVPWMKIRYTTTKPKWAIKLINWHNPCVVGFCHVWIHHQRRNITCSVMLEEKDKYLWEKLYSISPFLQKQYFNYMHWDRVWVFLTYILETYVRCMVGYIISFHLSLCD